MSMLSDPTVTFMMNRKFCTFELGKQLDSESFTKKVPLSLEMGLKNTQGTVDKKRRP